MNKIKIYQVDAFTNKLFAGNPAAVCPLDKWLPDEVMQSIALENNYSETAFFIKNQNKFFIRWFTPEVTSPILPGVMRSVLLSRAETLGDRVIESNIIFESTDELWMSNALRGLCPLTVNDSPPPSWSLLSIDKDLER